MSFVKKLFGKKSDGPSKEELAAAEKAEKKKKKKMERGHTVDTAALDKRTSDDVAKDKKLKKSGSSSSGGGGATAKPKPKSTTSAVRSKKRKDKSKSSNVHVNTDEPLEFPCTPEIIMEYHKVKPFLTQNEEWLLVELNEFECLVDGMDIIKIIAKHSKFFEVDPDELWEEFFEYVEEMPSYDEVINYDVWQEFRDEKYPC